MVSNVQVLNLHGNSLTKIKEISRLTALRHLTVSFNKFTNLDDISHMVRIAQKYHWITLKRMESFVIISTRNIFYVECLNCSPTLSFWMLATTMWLVLKA